MKRNCPGFLPARNRRAMMPYLAAGIVMLISCGRGGATEPMFEISIGGLQELDRTIEQIRSEGMVNLVRSKLEDATREHFPALFGGQADKVDRVLKTSEHAYSIQSRGTTAVRGMFNSGSAAEAQQHSDEFWGWLSGEKLREMAKELVPGAAREVVEGVENFVDKTAWLADKGEQTMDAAGSVAGRVKEYFSEHTGFGLEPGGADAAAVTAARAASPEPWLPEPEILETAAEWYALNVGEAEMDEPQTLVAAEEPAEPEAAAATARPRSPFDGEIQALEHGLGSGANNDRSGGGTFDAEIAALSADLGLDPNARPGGKTDWAREAQDLETGIRQWEAEQARLEAERRARIAYQLEQLRLAELRRQQQEAARQQYFVTQEAPRANPSRHDSFSNSEASPAERPSPGNSTAGSMIRSIFDAATQGYLQRELQKRQREQSSQSGGSGGSGPGNRGSLTEYCLRNPVADFCKCIRAGRRDCSSK